MSALSEQWRDWSCTVRVSVQSSDQSDLAAAVEATYTVMNTVQRSVDRFDSTSDLSRVNASPGDLVAVDPLTIDLVELGLEAARRTDGLCDPTVGRALLLAGYSSDIDQLRNRTIDAEPARRAAGWRTVSVDRAGSAIGVQPDGLLDLGAVAKAWAADTAAREATSRTSRATLVSIGGDVAVAASAGGADQRPWLIDVSETENGRGQQVMLTHGGLTTSSIGGRRWRTTSGPRNHLIDPRTGASARGPWRTCTVWAEQAHRANEASTAALLCGANAPGWLSARGYAGRLVHRDGWVLNVGPWPTDAAVVA